MKERDCKEEVEDCVKKFPSEINSRYIGGFRKGFFGGNLLHWACIFGRERTVKFLVESTNVDFKSVFEEKDDARRKYLYFKNKTPLEIAEVYKNQNIIKILKTVLNPPDTQQIPPTTEPIQPVSISIPSTQPNEQFFIQPKGNLENQWDSSSVIPLFEAHLKKNFE